ncbi:MAG: ribonuclease HII [Nanoarchaeota archaeon]|nr:ribonuclease HII [Nanoarchaeota archaeon]
MSYLILGIDDAGRGPIIGPMILAGVLLDKNGEEILKKHNVRDSKTVLHPTRVKLAELIKETSLGHHLAITSPDQIDKAINTGTNLNTLEAIKTAEIINALNNQKDKIKVIVDCPSVNIKAWRATLLGFIKNKENLEVICEHKADANHVSVSGASILAKVTREDEIEKLKSQYGNFGSGYPADPLTKKFLKSSGSKLKDSGLFRKTWSTWKVLFPDKNQASLRDY